MLVFWRYGYETTSIVDLTTAMGITAPSLYTAFGDKKRLFLEAARRYAGDPDAMVEAIGNAPTALDAARRVMTDAVTGYTGATTPRGCLLASATASGSAASAEVQDLIADIRRGIVDQLRLRIERDVSDRVLPPGIEVQALAGMVVAVIQGMSVLARDGHQRTALMAIVESALRAWPTQRGDLDLLRVDPAER